MLPADVTRGQQSMTETAGLPFPTFRRGKVRDVFDLGDRLLIVATDRLSAFDVVLPTPIPGKGRVLTAISNFWFNSTADLVPNHRTPDSIDRLGLQPDQVDMLAGRAIVVRKADRINIECVVRGNLAGSGWKEYQAQGTLVGEPLPEGLRRGDPLPDSRFTPAAKNDVGHDQNISRAELADRVGADLARDLEAVSVALFEHGREVANRAGFTLADTKFEFGFVDGTLTLIDEALTPDSSRYWDTTSWTEGSEPPSFDKQVVRDWLEQCGWNKEAPGPELPAGIVEAAGQKYAEVLRRLTALDFEEQRRANL